MSVAPAAVRRRLPAHGLLGALLVLSGELLILVRHRPYSDYYFPFAWLGYVLVVDAAVKVQTGRSLWIDARRQFLALQCLSIGFWWLFELFNVAVQNWIYVGASGYTGLGYVAFASVDFSLVLPAVWVSAMFVNALLARPRALSPLGYGPVRSGKLLAAMVIAGIASVLLTIFIPRIAFGLTWVSVYLLLDPINYLSGRPAMIAAFVNREFRLPLSFALGTLMCGFFWEAWNYWAMPKWTYDIPYVGFWHIFEMPLLGWTGYLPFGLELFAMANFMLPILGLGTLGLDVPDSRGRETCGDVHLSAAGSAGSLGSRER